MRYAWILIVGMLGFVFGCGRSTNPSNSPESPAPSAQPIAAASPSAPTPLVVQKVPVPQVDRSVPLDRYAVIDTHSAQLLEIALHKPSLSDDVVMSLMSPETQTEDVFRRRDAMARELPAIKDKIKAILQHVLYYKVDATTFTDPAGIPIDKTRAAWGIQSVWFGILPVGPYNFEERAFEIRPLELVAPVDLYDGKGSGISLSPTGKLDICGFREALGTSPVKGKPILLKVDDEIMARKLESLRAPRRGFRCNTTLYFLVAASDQCMASGELNVVLSHVDLTVLDPSDREHAIDIASFSIDL
jgi:hypothetical protein